MWIKFLDYFGNFYNEVGWLIFWLKKKKGVDYYMVLYIKDYLVNWNSEFK